MFRALVNKEWRQLNSLRWVGLGMGLLVGPFLLGIAEAASRGWFARGKIDSYSMETVLIEVLPAMLVALWVLLTLLIVGQSFAGDRAAGTEWFLLERPVPRPRIWQARIVAALVTIVLLAASHLAVWWLLSRLVDPAMANWDRAWIAFFGVGPLAVGVAFLAAMAASSFGSSPVQAILLAIVLGALPAGLAAVLSGLFPMALYRQVPLGFVVPVLFLIGCGLSSFRMQCLGEPAGRGRILRGVVVLAIALVSVPALFAISAPLALRGEANRVAKPAHVIASPGGTIALALTSQYGSGWMIDLQRAEKQRFMAPPVFEAVWNAEGSRLAVLHGASMLGAYSINGSIDLYDAGGSLIKRISGRDDVQLAGALRWAGDRLVARTFEGRGASGLLVVSTRVGEMQKTVFDMSYRDWNLVGPTPDGTVFVYRLLENEQGRRGVLQRLALDPVAIEPEVIWEDPEFASVAEDDSQNYFLRIHMSPEGRYLYRYGGDWFVELESGAVTRRAVRSGVWFDDDRRVELQTDGGETRLLVGSIEEPAVVRSWSDLSIRFEASPDRRRLLILGYEIDAKVPDDPLMFMKATREGALLRELWIYELESGAWTDATEWFGTDSVYPEEQIEWAGPETLFHTGTGFVALRKITGSAPVYLLGG